MRGPNRILMCAPKFYSVDYVINPWMEGNIHKAIYETACDQWQQLHQHLEKSANIELIPPQPGLPDMVFTANAGVVVGKKVVVSRFMHRERQPEEPWFQKWFQKHGFETFEMPPDLPFEGAGDALMDHSHGWLWVAYGSRTELDTHPLLSEWLDIEVVSLRLSDPRFYHLDTCFCPLEGGYVMYYPTAFDTGSNRLIEQRVPTDKRITVSDADAVSFACNAVNLGRHVYVNELTIQLKAKLGAAGFEVIETPLTEFIKSGGAAKCLTLKLNEPKPVKAHAECSFQSRRLKLEGHLLDSGLLERALDLTVETGGSFQVINFHLGKQRQSTSDAEIKISAPSEETMDKIMERLIAIGVMPLPTENLDAELKPVTQAGVAPDDFYATTIYPTEVRVNGHWLRVLDQRMDGVVVIATEGKNLVARCRIFRRLSLGDRVVTGSSGIRTVRKPAVREPQGTPPAEPEFAFMGAGVSSERRVELAVERIAWEMGHIRGQGGKIIVVAGPVVVHTGGARHLSWLVRNGYINGVLGGNGVATHDIEQAILGTSLGVDLKRGASVHGGHRHHLRVINLIRRCGSIKAAVEQGVLTRGIFYECVQKGLPFVLAGSIRDDGPLPDTEMDMLKAQDRYAELVRNADMILMLSSMLHSIGVGNMTPAGVKLVCVDINPAVVTKLSDRGSVESIGVVTDVGLFLHLLAERLRKHELVQEAA